eukprot:CAMPEP_0170125152 /NCGR_PEP_ID=MMETSP0020_2-20130122/18773_1 /TAXON_ID=98059 /ORGANISM="Dinobryon sp., Strain UTEXLB2267" /LENGTH=50 /DNA_ID=CAMNT_0010357563 /DNA_START=195 /DNA_END=344 /DNA_ORIENTATION=+
MANDWYDEVTALEVSNWLLMGVNEFAAKSTSVESTDHVVFNFELYGIDIF